MFIARGFMKHESLLIHWHVIFVSWYLIVMTLESVYIANANARDVDATHTLTMWSLWWERTKVATLSIRTRSLREKLFESVGRKYVFKFCKDVCEVHKQGKLQGKDVVWEYVQDIFHNLVRSKSGRRYSASTQSIYEMIKLWGGPRLHSFISLNLDGPRYLQL